MENVNQMNFNLPHDMVLLPSEGRYYKNKKKSVKVGYLTAADENILASAGNMGGNQIILNLIRSKMYEPDLRPEEMLQGDIEAILIFIRNTSFGNEYSFSLTDPETGKKFEKQINLESFDFIKSSIEPDSEGLISIQLPKSGANIKMKFLTFGEEDSIQKQLNTYPKNIVAPTVTLRLSKIIKEINGNRDIDEINKFIGQMPIADSKFITKFIEENEPKLNLTVEILAPSGQKVTPRVSFGVEFFRPFF